VIATDHQLKPSSSPQVQLPAPVDAATQQIASAEELSS
jgi:hypothetical protein